MEKVRIALIGAGQRGMDVYGAYIAQHAEEVMCVAVAEPVDERREKFLREHQINEERAYKSWEDLLAEDKFCDAVIIATPDDLHYQPAKRALELGYHVLLEKPMSNDPLECVHLGLLAQELQCVFLISHVLRYTVFFNTIKAALDSGAIGQVMSLQHNENIGYFHMAHSFVRGNWRSTEESSPIILAKSCHDMDMILYLSGSSCQSIASFGQLSYFTPANAPENSADRCLQCPVENTCIYSAKRQYLGSLGFWPSTVVCAEQSEQAVLEALETSPYGRCVYKCDNDVCDHQVTIMSFASGATATFNLSAFTNKVHRTFKIMGTLGELRADDSKNEIEIRLFGSDERTVLQPTTTAGGHGGGDYGLMKDFVDLIRNGAGNALTAAHKSVEGHLMSFAAEKSRLTGRVISVEDELAEHLQTLERDERA